MAKFRHDIRKLPPHVRTYKEARGLAKPPPRLKTVFDDNVLSQFEFQKRRCWYCGLKMEKSWITVDHYNPRSVGGNDDPENLVVACYRCNQKKADLLPNQHCRQVLQPKWQSEDRLMYWGEVCRELEIQRNQREAFDKRKKVKSNEVS